MMMSMNSRANRSKSSRWTIRLPQQLLSTVVVALLLVLQSTTTTTTTTTMVSASVFMPYNTKSTTTTTLNNINPHHHHHHLSTSNVQKLRLAVRRQQQSSSASSSVDTTVLAMAIPGYGVAEQVIVGGFGNFLSIYNLVITARILLSWFPQAASIGALQPVYAITDPYLNLFRNIIPPLFGLDFSPILAFVLLNVLTNATAAVGCEIPKGMTTVHNGMNPRHRMGHPYQHHGCHMSTSNQIPRKEQRRFLVSKFLSNI